MTRPDEHAKPHQQDRHQRAASTRDDTSITDTSNNIHTSNTDTSNNIHTSNTSNTDTSNTINTDTSNTINTDTSNTHQRHRNERDDMSETAWRR